MYAYLDGLLTLKSPALVHLEVQGIGFEIQISLNTFSRIQHLERCRLHTHLSIKEDAHTLYGFYELAEKQVFVQLISVSGIGASTARIILSSLQPEELRAAIVRGDDQLLERIKGIGPKSAKRLVLELKDKMHKEVLDVQNIPSRDNTVQGDALNALLALGIGRSAAETALQKVLRSQAEPSSLEDVVKQALKSL